MKTTSALVQKVGEDASENHIGALTRQQQKLFSIHTARRNTVDVTKLQTKYTPTSFLGKGTYGVVVGAEGILPLSEKEQVAALPAARPKRGAGPQPPPPPAVEQQKVQNLVIKFQLTDGEELVREGRIQRMLTELWTNLGPDLVTAAPVLKAYDYTDKTQRISISKLIPWLTSSMNPVDAKRTADAIFSLLEPDLEPPGNLPFGAPPEMIERDQAVRAAFEKAVLDDAAMLVAERIGKPWSAYVNQRALWPSLFVQFFLFLHSHQSLLRLVHGDAHSGNVYAVGYSQPIRLRIAAGRNAVFYVYTNALMKVGDFGMTYLHVPEPLDDVYDLKKVEYPDDSGYDFQAGGENVYRPWQDQMRLAWSLFRDMSKETYESLSYFERLLFACMIDVEVANIIDVPRHMVDQEDNYKATFINADRLRRTAVAVLRAPTITPNIDFQTVQNATQANKFLVYNVRRYYSPRDIIENNMGVFSSVLQTTAPADNDKTPLYDLTLDFGNRSTGNLPDWKMPLPISTTLPVLNRPPSLAPDIIRIRRQPSPVEEKKPIAGTSGQMSIDVSPKGQKRTAESPSTPQRGVPQK